MRTALALLLTASSVHAASGGPPTMPPDVKARLHAILANGADASTSALVVMDPGQPARPLHTLRHAPGLLPRGLRHGNATWLVVADGPSRLGEPASLWRFPDEGTPERLMDGLMAQQRPVRTEDGRVLVLSDDGLHERTSRRMRLHAVNASGAQQLVLERDVSWMVPLGGRDGAVDVLVQDGREARVLRVGDGKVETLYAAAALLRDVHVRDGWIVAVEASPQGAALVKVQAGKRTVLATRGEPLMEPVLVGETVVWSEGAGRGLRTSAGSALAVYPQAISVPVLADGGLVLARVDSAGASGRADGRLPSSWVIADVLRGKTWRLKTRGALLQPISIEAGGGR